jgi:hypothetical protein
MVRADSQTLLPVPPRYAPMRKAVATKVGASVDTMSPTGSPACALTFVVKPSI